jgi:hypothetical protein
MKNTNKLYYLYTRFECSKCDEKFTTGRCRDIHQRCCGRTSKIRRLNTAQGDPAGTTSAIDGLFKIIEFISNIDSPLIVEALHDENDRLSDILR